LKRSPQQEQKQEEQDGLSNNSCYLGHNKNSDDDDDDDNDDDAPMGTLKSRELTSRDHLKIVGTDLARPDNAAPGQTEVYKFYGARDII